MSRADNSPTEQQQEEYCCQSGRFWAFTDSRAVHISRCTADVAVQRESISTEEVDGIAAKHGIFARLGLVSFEGKS
jgi:hypothetical protein